MAYIVLWGAYFVLGRNVFSAIFRFQCTDILSLSRVLRVQDGACFFFFTHMFEYSVPSSLLRHVVIARTAVRRHRDGGDIWTGGGVALRNIDQGYCIYLARKSDSAAQQKRQDYCGEVGGGFGAADAAAMRRRRLQVCCFSPSCILFPSFPSVTSLLVPFLFPLFSFLPLPDLASDLSSLSILWIILTRV
ncbi:hypothetical protein DFH08DRAFT_39644 [Mycena albidolilacea]|uniref:Uncharacterized protein n=1 Tax=Mycena albidolilacea TaxID=1033008 RepID=A0AAD7AWT6_9AGAR|nr:hypothetical protein DFH08DRAFT_39644 [Mycena albidolilacea]